MRGRAVLDGNRLNPGRFLQMEIRRSFAARPAHDECLETKGVSLSDKITQTARDSAFHVLFHSILSA
jgi:hypothetical protein